MICSLETGYCADPSGLSVCSVMPGNGLHLMSFLSSAPLFRSRWQVSQRTKEDRQPGASGTLLRLPRVLRHVSERFCTWLSGFSPASVSSPV